VRATWLWGEYLTGGDREKLIARGARHTFCPRIL
jgi:hypothetical protein